MINKMTEKLELKFDNTAGLSNLLTFDKTVALSINDFMKYGVIDIKPKYNPTTKTNTEIKWADILITFKSAEPDVRYIQVRLVGMPNTQGELIIKKRMVEGSS